MKKKEAMEQTLHTAREQYCRCNDILDIRARCLPNRNAILFSICPARFDTAIWLMENDYDFVRAYERGEDTKDFFVSIFGITFTVEERAYLMGIYAGYRQEEEEDE